MKYQITGKDIPCAQTDKDADYAESRKEQDLFWAVCCLTTALIFLSMVAAVLLK